jgi:signal transduction histidine kinase
LLAIAFCLGEKTIFVPEFFNIMPEFFNFVTFGLVVMLCNVYLNVIILPIMRKNVNQVELDNTDRRRFSASGSPGGTDNYQSADNLEKIIHDIRGSISVINVYAQIMLDEVNGKINTEQRQALEDILSCGNRLSDLTDNLFKQTENESAKK